MVSMKWQISPGMGGSFKPELYIALRLCPATYSGRPAENGRFRTECLAIYARNGWKLSAGMGGKFGPEYSARGLATVATRSVQDPTASAKTRSGLTSRYMRASSDSS